MVTLIAIESMNILEGNKNKDVIHVNCSETLVETGFVAVGEAKHCPRGPPGR
jgi:hypothetical protein